MTSDQTAEPYAALVEEGRRVANRSTPGELHAWLHQRMSTLAAAAGLRTIPPHMWLAAMSVALAVIPPDTPWSLLTGDWMRSQRGRVDR